VKSAVAIPHSKSGRADWRKFPEYVLAVRRPATSALRPNGSRHAVIFHQISDWNDAYANGPNIPGGERWPAAWVQPAQAYRDELQASGRATFDIGYGERPRNRFDLFRPEGRAKGLVVFVHGGFWRALDKSFWSHLARGSIESGYAVAIPSYTLCPAVRIADITREVAAAIELMASMVEGPVFLTGHSAGGHLVTRMISATSPLPDLVRARIRNTISISGVHDLRPMLNTAMNADLRIGRGGSADRKPGIVGALGQCPGDMLGRQCGAPGIHPSERTSCQHLDRARRANPHDRRTRPAPFQRH